jgi:hypothetical protein
MQTRLGAGGRDRIVRLASDCLTNREIADRLFL